MGKRNSKELTRPWDRDYYKKNTQKRRENSKRCRIKKTFNISLAEYEEIFKRQKGLCLICAKPMTIYTGTAHLDHNHNTGKVRGFLCRVCNMGLGAFRDDPNIIQSAINYLERHK